MPGEGGEEPNDRSIPIRGLQGELPVRFAPNGGAVPGDRIVGILTPGEGITIYPIQSPALTAFDEQPERWLDVRWDVEEGGGEFFPARMVITAINEPGALGTISTVIGDLAANIDNVVFRPLSADFREMTIDVEVNDLKHLNAIISNLRSRSVVSKVERVNG
jgi:GTP pyrophosphokinase